MAVPPIQRSPRAPAPGPTAGVTFPWLLDTVLALLIVAALPLAIVAIPNTVSVVGALLPEGFDRLELMRAHGLALPAMILTVPLASVALGRMRVAYVLVGGLALLAVADAAGGYAGSTFLVGVLRVLHGIGAGLLIPATLVAVWQRPPVLRAIWTGMLSLSLLAAQALALWPLDGIHNWKVTLQPYPMLTGIALGLAAAYLVVWQLHGRQPAAAPRASERSRLLLATVPAAGISVLAISTATDDWRANLVILVAVLAVGALLALASTGTREGRTFAYTMVAVGTVLLPSVAQLTYVEMKGLGGPGLKGLWIPFVVAGLLAVAAAVVVRLFAGAATRWLTPLGLLTMVVGLCSIRVVVPAQEGLVMVVPLTLLAVGAAVAVTAALGKAGLGSALFGLALCFPGVLAGYLLGTGVQMAMLRGVTSTQELVDRFVGALHLWALIGGFVVVVVILLTSLLARRASISDRGSSAAAGGGSADEIDPVPVPDGAAVAAPSGEDASGRDASAFADPPAPTASSQRGREPSTAADPAGEPAQPVEEDEPTGALPRVPSPMIGDALTAKAAPDEAPPQVRRAGRRSPSSATPQVGEGAAREGGRSVSETSQVSGTEAEARSEGDSSPEVRGEVKAGASAGGGEETPTVTAEDDRPGLTHEGKNAGRSGAGRGRGNADAGRPARLGAEASVPRQGGPEQADAPAESTGPLPPVPPPTPSPEDSGSP